jgi:hypothetical protein
VVRESLTKDQLSGGDELFHFVQSIARHRDYLFSGDFFVGFVGSELFGFVGSELTL